MLTSPADNDRLIYDAGAGKWVNEAASAGSGAPTDADYLVGTANGDLSAEIVVGTSPGGELGGTWASPTVDTVHSGSSHAATQAAAEATAAAALSAHDADTTGIHGIPDTSALLDTGDIGSTVPAIATFNDHSARHEDGGADEISIAGLSGTSAALQAHLDDTTDAHDASAISSVAAGNLAATDVQAALNELDTEKQPVDSDLTAIAGLSPTNDDFIQRKSGVWVNRSVAQVLADLAAAGTTFQPLDADLTAIAALADPDADRILFWDDSLGAFTFLTVSTGLSISGTSLTATGGGDMVRLADTTLGSDSATIDITSISGSYKHLKVVCYLRSTHNNTAKPRLTFNGDTGTNYGFQIQQANSTGTAQSAGASQASLDIGAMPDTRYPTGVFGAFEFTIPNYANASFKKSLTGQSGAPDYTTASNNVHTDFQGVWNSTSAINQITLTASTANMLTGSRVTVYGLN